MKWAVLAVLVLLGLAMLAAGGVVIWSVFGGNYANWRDVNREVS